jgi:branched-chain amino acid aminotransferase
MKVWIEGRIVEGADARIPVTDHGLLYGDGVFEGIRVYGGRVLRLDAHLRRMYASARLLGLAIPEGLHEIVLDTLRAFGAENAYARLIVTRGEGPLGVDPTRCGPPRTICIVDELQIYAPEKAARGLDLVTVSMRQPASDVLDPRVKSLNYLNSVLAKLEARRRDADEALILNAAGNVAEAAVANVFCVRGGLLLTPLATDGALEGITRDSVLRLAGELGIPAREQTLGRYDLLSGEEVFLTGSGVGIAPVRSLDGEVISSEVPGPLTAKLRAAFLDLVHSEGTPIVS